MAMNNQEIKVLFEQRDSLKHRLENTDAELNHFESKLEKKTNRLLTLQRRYAVTKSQIKSVEDDIFQLKRKLKTFKETAAMLLPEIEKQTQVLNDLTQSKNRLENNIRSARENIKSFKDNNDRLDRMLSGNRQQLHQLHMDKKEISDEIAKKLSRTSLQQEKVEADLFQINEQYIAHLNTKNKLNQELTELDSTIADKKRATSELKAKLFELTRAKALTEENQTLQTAIVQHKKKHDQNHQKLESLKRFAVSAQTMFERISNENVQRLNNIQSLESNVTHYDSALNASKKMISEHQELSKQIDTHLSTIKKMLEDQHSLEFDLKLAEEKALMVVDDLLVIQ
ncbi:MAG: hypothetical protein HQK75_19360 [Candidatus Magnetomorum sp.]|nr:hypothetical protein [Candidatus Magnetomorum sp.]